MKLVAILCAIFCLNYYSICQAETFNNDGYKIDIYWKQKGNELSSWGNVFGGESCKQLNLSIFFANSGDSHSGHVEAAIKNYNPNLSMNFKGSDQVYADRSEKKKWHVDRIFTECLQ